MDVDCKATFFCIGRLGRVVDLILRGHTTHTCVRSAPVHALNHICRCGKQCPIIVTSLKDRK